MSMMGTRVTCRAESQSSTATEHCVDSASWAKLAEHGGERL
jgi:hypothetical protein